MDSSSSTVAGAVATGAKPAAEPSFLPSALLGQCLADRLELLRCYYNFVRPHMALRFGPEVRTPAMQAGLVDRRLTFRDIFAAVADFFSFLALLIRTRWPRQEFISRLAVAQ